MKIKTLIVHPKGSVITLPGAEYRPEIQPDGEQVFEVKDPAHIERLLAITEGFAEYAPGKAAAVKKADDKPAEVAKTGAEILVGSSVHPATFEIGGQTFQLGTVVAMAHTASGLSVADWNALADDERHARIDAELDRLEAEAEAAGGGADTKPAALPDFATMKAPELMAYAGEHLPDATINPKTPLTTLRKLIHKLATAKATAAAPAA
jgi:hypothetical protein